jgi:hypothetical protein
VAGERAAWLARREQISRWTRANYSVEVMVTAFVSALRLPDIGPAVPLEQHEAAAPPAKPAP